MEFSHLLVWKLSQIPHCLGLCRNNPNKSVFSCLELGFVVCFDVVWFGLEISN